MRSDYLLYAVAVICFVIAGLTFIPEWSPFERNVSAVAAVVFGLAALGLGFYQRPRTQVSTVQEPSLPISPPAPPPVAQAPEVVETPKPEVVEASEPEVVETVAETSTAVTSVVTPIAPIPRLTNVKGIKEKRAEQLRALGIHSVEDLANASASDLAARLKIAQYFPEKWIQAAKELTGKQ